MKRSLIIAVLFLLLSMPLSAQDCGHGLPCGAIPWAIPQLPALPSPTPFPTVLVNMTSTPTPTRTPTPGGTPAPTATAQLNTGAINDQVATLSAIIDQTPEATFEPVFGSQDLAGNSGMFFGYVLGLQNLHFGVLTPLLTFVMFCFLYVLGTKVFLMLLPVLAAIYGVVRNIISLILEFLPF